MQNLSFTRARRLIKHSARNRRPLHWMRGILVVLFAVALAFSTVAVYKYKQLHDSLKQTIVSNTDSLVNKVPSSKEPPPDSYAGRAVNILLMGRDNVDENGELREGDSGLGMRNDTTIIMHISADRTRVQMVSIPRDSLVEMPECRRSDGTVARQEYGMFNAAFSRGGAHGDIGSAAACVINTVQAITGIYIDDFVVVDFAGFRGMVDAVGGVELCLDHRYADPQYTELDVGPGCVTMDGLTATKYARARHLTNTDGSDTSRIQRQQKLLGKLISRALARGLWDQVNFAHEALQNSNMSPRLGSVNTLMGLATSLASIDRRYIVFATAPWAPAPSDPNRVVLSSRAEDVWEALREDIPLPDGIERKDAEGNTRESFTPEDVPVPTPSTSTDTENK